MYFNVTWGFLLNDHSETSAVQAEHMHSPQVQSQSARLRTSFMVQCIRSCLPMQGMQVQSPVWEDPTCYGATKPMCHYWLAHKSLQVTATEPARHDYWSLRSLGPASHNLWTLVPQLLKPTAGQQVTLLSPCLQLLRPAPLELMFHNKRSHYNQEKSLQEVTTNKRSPQTTARE